MQDPIKLPFSYACLYNFSIMTLNCNKHFCVHIRRKRLQRRLQLSSQRKLSVILHQPRPSRRKVKNQKQRVQGELM